MKVSDFNYNLPQELIAQEPIPNRQMSRLLVLDKNTGSIEHRIFKDVLEYVNKGDCLVLNDTRLFGKASRRKRGDRRKIEFVLLKKIENDIWNYFKPGKRAKPVQGLCLEMVFLKQRL